MCQKAVFEDPHSFEFVPDCFVTTIMLEGFYYDDGLITWC